MNVNHTTHGQHGELGQSYESMKSCYKQVWLAYIMSLMNGNFGTYVCTTLSIDVKGVSMCECTYKCAFNNVSILKQLWFGCMCFILY
jgi:hypothetical protein